MGEEIEVCSQENVGSFLSQSELYRFSHNFRGASSRVVSFLDWSSKSHIFFLDLFYKNAYYID